MVRLIPGNIRAKACPFENVRRLCMEGVEPGLGAMHPQALPTPPQYQARPWPQAKGATAQGSKEPKGIICFSLLGYYQTPFRAFGPEILYLAFICIPEHTSISRLRKKLESKLIEEIRFKISFTLMINEKKLKSFEEIDVLRLSIEEIDRRNQNQLEKSSSLTCRLKKSIEEIWTSVFVSRSRLFSLSLRLRNLFSASDS